MFGRVLDLNTNEGVSGASIDFYILGLNAVASSVTTDDAGRYSAILTRGVSYTPRINGPNVDSNRGIVVPVAKETKDILLINGGTCVVYYGSVRDANTGEPLSGASVTFLSETRQTGPDGWYRIDFGCPSPTNPWQRGTGTRFMTVSRPGYASATPYGNRVETLPTDRTMRIDVVLKPTA